MAAMPRPRPPHLQLRKTRHGKNAWYVRVARGPLIRIRPDYGTPEFDAAYQAALNGEQPPATAPGPAKDSIGWLVNLYLASGAWKDLAKGTRERRLPQLNQVIKTSGSYPKTSITKKALLDARDKREAPSQKRTFIMAMRSMFEWAVESKNADSNPTEGIKIKEKKTKGHIPWSEEDLVKYERRWSLGTKERVMLDVYAYTGLRRGDAARVGPSHVRKGVISIVTEKSPTPVTIPILKPLAASLKVGPIGGTSFNAGRYGLPYTARGLGKAFLKACRAAGLVNRTAHGLRKAAATRAAENGATDKELDAIFGWKDGQMSRIYTKNADRVLMAGRAMGKVNRKPMLPPKKKVVAPKEIVQ
jgi:integrase